MDERRGTRRGAMAGSGLVALAAVAAVWLLCGDEPTRRDPAQDALARAACDYREIDAPPLGEELLNPPEIRATHKVLKTHLRVAYTKKATTEIAGCPVRLRSYDGKLIGPTLRLSPGDTLDLKVRNRLPRESKARLAAEIQEQTDAAHIATVPHGYNTTNLHTHGLHVSPRANGDNVLLKVGPQKTRHYDIELPRDHPRGTYWYHPHAHGSTAIQVGSGMAGAIIVEDDEHKIPPELAAANEREKVMLFQQILYDTSGRSETIEAFFFEDDATKELCAEGKPGCTWQSSGRRTTINGQLVPTIHMQPGEVQRWRMIGGGFREEMKIRLEGHDLHEIALDGVYLGRVDTWEGESDQTVLLEPGYRSDVLVKAAMVTEETTFDLIDAESSVGLSSGDPEDQELLARVVVSGEPVDMGLPTDEQMAALAPFRGIDLAEKAVDVEVASFKVGHDLAAAPRKYFHVNFEAFDPKRVRKVELGTIAQWSLSAVGDPASVPNPIAAAPHVFHIHVNPFQMIRDDPAGNPETVWKDTVLVPPAAPVTVYTRYNDYTGKFVMHCHILDHEDLGMMQVIKVVRGGVLAPRTGGHH